MYVCFEEQFCHELELNDFWLRTYLLTYMCKHNSSSVPRQFDFLFSLKTPLAKPHICLLFLSLEAYITY